MTVSFTHCTMVFRSSRFTGHHSQSLEALFEFDWQVSCAQASVSSDTEWLYILANIARIPYHRDVCLTHGLREVEHIYFNLFHLCSDAQTYWRCCLETYWHCSVSARLIGVAFRDLLALQPITVIVTSERRWWVYCSFTCNPDTPLFLSLGYL